MLGKGAKSEKILSGSIKTVKFNGKYKMALRKKRNCNLNLPLLCSKINAGAEGGWCRTQKIRKLVVDNPLPAMSFLRTWEEKEWIKAL